MINGGYYFIQRGDNFLGIPPEYIEEAIPLLLSAEE
jgi:hypothetical protein